jgi:hypothetical protein
LKNAETEIEERLLRLELGWLRCSAQLNSLKKWQGIMDDVHISLQERMLHVFVGKLEIATSILRRLVKTDNQASQVVLVPLKLKYAFRKESLDEAVEVFESWQRISDPAWFLNLKMTDHILDDELSTKSSEVASCIPSALVIRDIKTEINSNEDVRTGVTLPAAALGQMIISNLRFSNVSIAENSDHTERLSYILNTIVVLESTDYHIIKANLRNLTRRLQHAEPHNFGLLSCKGFITERKMKSNIQQTFFTMVFYTPQGLTRPQSLRDQLLHMKSPGSLSHRFNIARQLANSVNYVHTFGFVHKNVRPEMILSFVNAETSTPSIFLVGFDNLRHADGRTRRLGDDSYEKNLYRHTSRQGLSPEKDYIMQHDIYSLGVCLLEVGLWHSFIDYDGDYTTPKLSSILDLPANLTTVQVNHYLSHEAKEDFVKIARFQLPEVMGSKYAKIVETCLTCLDSDNEDFGDPTEFEDEDGIRVGVRYIEKILYRLNQLYV